MPKPEPKTSRQGKAAKAPRPPKPSKIVKLAIDRVAAEQGKAPKPQPKKPQTYTPTDTSRERELFVEVMFSTYGSDEQAERTVRSVIRDVAVSMHREVFGWQNTDDGMLEQYTYDSSGKCISHPEIEDRE